MARNLRQKSQDHRRLRLRAARSAGPRPGGFTAVVSGGGWTRLAAYSEPVHSTYARAVGTGVADRLEVGGTGRGMASRRSRGAVVPGAHVDTAAAGRRDRELGRGAERKGPSPRRDALVGQRVERVERAARPGVAVRVDLPDDGGGGGRGAGRDDRRPGGET